MAISLKGAFLKQQDLQEILGIEIGDRPDYFEKAIAGIHEEAEEARKEDSRQKGIDLGMPDHPKIKYDKAAKTLELADVVIQVINACLFSDIHWIDLEDAIAQKQSEKRVSFRKLKGLDDDKIT